MDKGAHFHRCDFQVHTPRDKRWTGNRPTTEPERLEYARELIAACRKKGIHAIAITDHHDMVFVPYIRRAASEEIDQTGTPVQPEEQINVFPGMELTLGVPCQALLLFGADFPNDMFGLAATALAITPAASSEPTCNDVKRLDRIMTLAQLYEELDRHAFLKGHYIVLPNVSEGGASTLLRSGFPGRYRDMPCVGGYLDGKVDQLGEGNRTILSGRNGDYGNKSLALFQTSDNRHRDHRLLGDSTTWVKWAEPTAEALRQACLARESRISQDKPIVPSIAITGVNISNSSFMGPINLELNSQYNAIIGGRGTGKSTILEYVRWALCDEPPATDDSEELASYDAKRKKLISQTLAPFGANVQVDFVINGVPHSVRRDSAKNELTLKIGNESYQPCTESDVRNILAVQAYSQKQLSSVGVRLDELTRFIHVPIMQQLHDLDSRLKQISIESRNKYSLLQKKRSLQKEVLNDERELRSLTERVTTIRGNLTGIGTEEQRILSQYEAYQREQEIIDSWMQLIQNVNEAFVNLRDLTLNALNSVSEDGLEKLPNSALIGSIREQLSNVLSELHSETSKNIGALAQINHEDETYSVSLRQLEENHEEFKKSYELAKQKSSAHDTVLTQLSELEGRLKVIRDRLILQKNALTSVGNAEAQFANLREQWITIHDNRAALIEAQCGRMTQLSNGQIKATLKKGAIVKDIAQQLKSAFYGSSIRGTKIDDLCGSIAGDAKPMLKYQLILNELELLSILAQEDSAKDETPETPNLRAAGLTKNDLLKISQKLTPEAWLDLCLTTITDEPIFEYRTRENEYIPFSDASAGQQATSLLTVLLNQGGMPLIIDQPEDDLDNKVVVQIVEQIWKAKQSRQLIFSSHNANLVVNGDAELVICCDYRPGIDQSGGQVKCQGAIDVKPIRDEITNVMEGGEAAFKLRKQKYGF